MRDLLPVIKETTGSRSADEVVLLEKKFTKISENPLDKSTKMCYNMNIKSDRRGCDLVKAVRWFNSILTLDMGVSPANYSHQPNIAKREYQVVRLLSVASRHHTK